MNISSHFVPNKILLMIETHLPAPSPPPPPWMTENRKQKIHWKQTFTNSLRNQADYDILQQGISEVSGFVDDAKNNYYMLVNKSNRSTSSKIYWSILKTFFYNKKIPLIPPVIIRNKLESDFILRANHFNKYFASKYTSINNESSFSFAANLGFLL